MSQFIYPYSNQFPMDAVCAKIVRELEARNWQVPKIEVTFLTYGGSEDDMFKQVDLITGQIAGEKFLLEFQRDQGRVLTGTTADIAGISKIIIPGMELNIRCDEFGPVLYVYTGPDTKKNEFVNKERANFAKLRERPRTYLIYRGSERKPGEDGPERMIPSQRPPFLKPNSINDREYLPVEGEPQFYLTDEILKQFTLWLQDNVLARIIRY